MSVLPVVHQFFKGFVISGEGGVRGEGIFYWQSRHNQMPLFGGEGWNHPTEFSPLSFL